MNSASYMCVHAYLLSLHYIIHAYNLYYPEPIAEILAQLSPPSKIHRAPQALSHAINLTISSGSKIASEIQSSMPWRPQAPSSLVNFALFSTTRPSPRKSAIGVSSWWCFWILVFVFVLLHCSNSDALAVDPLAIIRAFRATSPPFAIKIPSI